MINLDECECTTPCPECEDCYVSKCECECEAEIGLKQIPEEGSDGFEEFDFDDDDDDEEVVEEEEEEDDEAYSAEDLGITVAHDRMPEY